MSENSKVTDAFDSMDNKSLLEELKGIGTQLAETQESKIKVYMKKYFLMLYRYIFVSLIGAIFTAFNLFVLSFEQDFKFSVLSFMLLILFMVILLVIIFVKFIVTGRDMQDIKIMDVLMELENILLIKDSMTQKVISENTEKTMDTMITKEATNASFLNELNGMYMGLIGDLKELVKDSLEGSTEHIKRVTDSQTLLLDAIKRGDLRFIIDPEKDVITDYSQEKIQRLKRRNNNE